MSLKEQLNEEMKAAMKQGEKVRLSVIRMIRSAIRNTEIDQGNDLDDEAVVEVVARELKQKKESLEAYLEAGREETAARLREEIDVLEEYLPEQLGEEEIRSLAEDVIEKVGAVDLSDLGRVMGEIMSEVKGRAQGSEVNRIVRELLDE